MTVHNPTQQDIRARLCRLKFESEVNTTLELMVDWIRDMKNIDKIALWYWEILRGIYHMDP
jgi:hypothetical protein